MASRLGLILEGSRELAGAGVSPLDRAAYPPNWADLRAAALSRSGGQCECEGQCGLHDSRLSGACLAANLHDACQWPRVCGCICHGPEPRDRRCEERNGLWAKWAKGKVVLTTAHLCNDPSCANLMHLRAMCNRCHIRIDQPLHREHAAASKRAHLEAAGQSRLLEG